MNWIYEAAYKGNFGMIEMIKLYAMMSEKEIEKLEKIVNNEDWEAYKKIVKKYLDVDLK